MNKVRKPRQVVLTKNLEDKVEVAEEQPQNTYRSPGYPLFPSAKFPNIKRGFIPSHVRVFKIMLGQPVAAEWFKGDPKKTDQEVFAKLWGGGSYKVEMVSKADDQHSPEVLFTNHIEVEGTEDEKPFPGADRGPKSLADASDGDGDGDGDPLYESEQEQAQDAPSSGTRVAASFQVPRPQPQYQQPQQPQYQQPQQPQYQPQQPQYQQPQTAMGLQGDGFPPLPQLPGMAGQVVMVVGVLSPFLKMFWDGQKEDRRLAQAREDRLAKESHDMMMLMFNKQQDHQQEVVKLASGSAGSTQSAEVAALRAELSALRDQRVRDGAGGGELAQLEKALAFADKFADRIGGKEGGGGDVLASLLKGLPDIAKIVSMVKGVTPEQIEMLTKMVGNAGGIPGLGK